VTKSGVSVCGHSAGTWLVNNTTAAPAIEQNGTSWGALRNMRIGQSSTVAAVAGNYGFRLLNTDQCTVDGVTIFNFPGAPYRGALFDNANDCHIHNVKALDCLSHGFHFTNGTDGSFADMFAFSNGGSGFQFESVSGFLGSNFHAYGNALSGFVFATGFLNQFVYGSNWLADTSHGVTVTGGANNVRFTNFLAGGTQPNGRSGSGSGFRFDAVTHCGLMNCRAYSNPSGGCVLSTGASDYLVIVGNDFSGNTGLGLDSSGSTGTHNQLANNAT
jgi:hypothetical protein